MDAVVASVLGKAVGQYKDTIDPGVHRVNIDVAVRNNITGVTTNLSVDGSVTKGEQELVTPTTSVPWLKVTAVLLRHCGVTKEAATKKVSELLFSYLSEGKEIDELMLEEDKSIAKEMEAVQKKILKDLPKVTREGKLTTSLLFSEQEEVKVVKGKSNVKV